MTDRYEVARIDDLDAPAGTLVVVRDPTVRRGATAVDADTLVLAVGGKPGEAFVPSAWESYFSAAPLADAGKFDEAIALMQRDAEVHRDHPALLYNLACYEALADRRDDALEHLARAVELNPRFREFAESDSDFAGLRDDPRFSDVVSRPAT